MIKIEELVLAFVSLELAHVPDTDPHANELRDYFGAMAVSIVDACITARLEVCARARRRQRFCCLGAARPLTNKPGAPPRRRMALRQDVLFGEVFDRFVECALESLLFKAVEAPLLGDVLGAVITAPVANGTAVGSRAACLTTTTTPD